VPTGHRQLRSAAIHQHMSCCEPGPIGDRSFDVTGPRLWNKLPAALRPTSNFTSSFRTRLKARLFCLIESDTVVLSDFSFSVAGYKYTYLLTYIVEYDFKTWYKLSSSRDTLMFKSVTGFAARERRQRYQSCWVQCKRDISCRQCGLAMRRTVDDTKSVSSRRPGA